MNSGQRHAGYYQGLLCWDCSEGGGGNVEEKSWLNGVGEHLGYGTRWAFEEVAGERRFHSAYGANIALC